MLLLSPLSADDTKLLKRTQQEGLLDLFAAVALADGRVTNEEIDALTQRLIVAVFEGQRWAIDHLQGAFVRFPRDVKSHAAFVRDAVTRLAAPELGERVVFALLLLGDCDHTHPAERAIITSIAAAFGLDIDRLAKLLERAAVHAIFPAAARGEVDTVRELLDAGTPIDTRDHLGWTPLHVAVARGHRELVALLLDRGAPLDAVHGQGSTALFCACNKPLPDIVRLLIEAGANSNRIGKYGFVPLHLAALSGQAGVAAALIDGGAHVDTADRDGNTPLHHAAFEGHDAVVELLVARGASPGAVNANGQTPLHRAALEDRDACVERLLAAGGDPNAADAAGKTPVFHAATNQPDALARLLARGGNPDRHSRTSGAPLHAAARDGLTTCARILIDAGAKLDATTEPVTGVTALALARASRRLDVQELLVARGASVITPGPPPREVLLDAIDWPGCARAPTRFGRADARAIVRHRGYESLVWLSPKRRGPVAVRDPAGRVWVVVTSGPEGLAAFQHATHGAIAWEQGEVAVMPRDHATIFAVADTFGDGVALDPFGPLPRLLALEDCLKILQVADPR